MFAIWDGATVTYGDKAETFGAIEWLRDYVAGEELKLPTAAAPYHSLNDLAERVRAFIHKYFDCAEPFEHTMALYGLMMSIFERFHAVPYLRFIGLPGSG